MKKILLSLAVIIAFVGYSIHEHQEGQQALTNVQTSRDNEALNPQITATPNSSSGNPPSDSSISYKDGTYTGSTEDVFYGNIQVRAIVDGGKLTDIEFLQYPNDRQTSIMINEQMIPILKQEAISAQRANVDIVSGATDSSQGFIRSLGNALAQAK